MISCWRALLVVLALGLLSPVLPVSAGEVPRANTFLLRNQEYGEAVLQGIKGARKSILCSFFLFKITGSARNQPRAIAEELIKAKKRGVDVTVILERDNGRKGGVTEDNRETAAFLSSGGVKVFFDSPAVVTHTKAVVIDGRYVYVGSHNLTQAALRHNNELSVMVDSPEMAAEVTSYLDRL